MPKEQMLKFTNIELSPPEKRDTGVRSADFREIYVDDSSDKIKNQASRCSQCGVPYCQSHCPLHNKFLIG